MELQKLMDNDDFPLYMTIREASLLYGYESSYLRKLCDAGKIRARLSGCVWILDASSLEDYRRKRNAS